MTSSRSISYIDQHATWHLRENLFFFKDTQDCDYVTSVPESIATGYSRCVGTESITGYILVDRRQIQPIPGVFRVIGIEQ